MKTTAFKNTDIGPIPEDWEVKKLGALMSFKNGFNAPAKAYGRGVPFVSVLDILAPFPITVESILGKVHADASTLNSFSVETGDLLFMRSSETQEDVGRSNVFVDSNSPVVFGGFVIRGRPFVEVDSVFLNYLLKDNAHRTRVSAKGAGAQHFNIGQIGLADVEITLPPLPEQRRIAAALSDADELVASLDKLIEKKKRVKEGAMQRLLSGETRLPGFTGKWVEKPVSDSLQSVGALNAPVKWRELQTPEEGSFPAFSASGQDVWTRNPIFHEDGIVVSAIGSRCGKAFLARGDWGVVANTHVILARNGACIPFWYYILNNEEWWIKAGTGQPYVLICASLARTMTTPEPDEQRAIATVLSDMDAEIAALSRERAEAERVKQGMMQELLTGKVRLT